MLSKVLEKSTCAECRFCCSFKRGSLWETPLFPKETVERLKKDRNVDFVLDETEGYEYGRMSLEGEYRTEDENEETPCMFLDGSRGCVLSDEDKPFDCKIWPLRIMRDGGELVIALTPTCPAINRVPLERMKELVEEGLGDTIYDYAASHPFIIKQYREGFPVLMRRNGGK